MNFARTTTPGIHAVVKETIGSIPDYDLAAAVLKSFEKEELSIKQVESFFARLSSQVWPKSVLHRFFHAWRDTHLSSSSVAAMTCRLLSLADENSNDAHCFTAAASANSKIVHEDLGLCGETHANLYDRLANVVCRTDEWKLETHRVASAYQFGAWVHHERVVNNIACGLQTTIASEIYNHGEYTFVEPLLRLWMQDLLGLSPEQTRRSLAYITVHTGSTESDHFMHGVEALKYYSSGVGTDFSYESVSATSAEYLRRVGSAFAGMNAIFNDIAVSSAQYVPVANVQTAAVRV